MSWKTHKERNEKWFEIFIWKKNWNEKKREIISISLGYSIKLVISVVIVSIITKIQANISYLLLVFSNL